MEKWAKMGDQEKLENLASKVNLDLKETRGSGGYRALRATEENLDLQEPRERMGSLGLLGVMGNLERRALWELQAEKDLVDQEESRASQVNRVHRGNQDSLELLEPGETRESPETPDYQALVALKAPRVHLVQSAQRENRVCQAELVIVVPREKRETVVRREIKDIQESQVCPETPDPPAGRATRG